MNSGKYKNTGNFATSASLAGLVMALHFASLQLLFADIGGSDAFAFDDPPIFATPAGAPNVIEIEPIVVTATRL